MFIKDPHSTIYIQIADEEYFTKLTKFAIKSIETYKEEHKDYSVNILSQLLKLK